MDIDLKVLLHSLGERTPLFLMVEELRGDNFSEPSTEAKGAIEALKGLGQPQLRGYHSGQLRGILHS